MGFSERDLYKANLIFFFDRVIDLLDKNNAVDLIYVDLSKMFGIMPPRNLAQFDRMGFKATFVRWIKD